MALSDIASRIDKVFEDATQAVSNIEATIVESDAKKMAHHIVAYVLERADAGHDPRQLGATMVQGATVGEDEAGGFLAAPVLQFLEALLDGAKSAIESEESSD